ncbi:MAG TPA: ATP-binding protein, partial [Streptosporangiaceae bacterium]
PANGEFCYATCGHPPPIVAARSGTARHLSGTGARPLGVGTGPLQVDARIRDGAAAAALRPGTAVLEPEDVLLLYSDGLIERPGRTLDAGLADLEIVAGDAAANPALTAWPAGTPAERVSHLTVELLARAGYGDDVTTLAVWRQPVPDVPLNVESLADPNAVATLRRALDGWLDTLGVAFGDRQLTELSVVEAVTNTVEHAYPPSRPGLVRLEASVGSDGYLETRVSDRGHWRPPDVTEADRGQGLSVARQFAEALRVSHPPQDAGEPPGARGTVVTMRHRLHRQPMLAPLAVGPPAGHAAQALFAIELVAAGPVPRIRVAGPVDFSTADRLAGRLLSACRAGVLPLSVDLSEVTILASAGVSALYRVAAQLAVHGRALTLISEPGSPAAAVLDLAQLPRMPR